MLINKRVSAGLNYLNESKAFIEYSNGMDDIYKNLQEYNPNRKPKVLVLFDDMITEMLRNKKLNPVVTDCLLEGKN